jgi:hypothetical protein
MPTFNSALRPSPHRLLLVLLLALAPGCRCSQDAPAAKPAPPPPPVPALGEVTIQDVTAEGERPAGAVLDLPALETNVRKSLADAGLFRTASGDAGSPARARVRIEVGLEEVAAEGKAAARAAVRMRIDTRPSEVAADHWNEDVQAGSEHVYELKGAAPVDRRELYGKLVAGTVSDLVAAYVTRQRLWTDDGTTARSALTKADAGEMRLEAIRVIGERKLSSAAPELLKLLEDEDENVRDAALGALVGLRDRRAVSVLAGQRSMRDRREMRKILDAIAVLGGPEAAEYLGFVADGHDDPEIRAIATQAKERMQRREDAASK